MARGRGHVIVRGRSERRLTEWGSSAAQGSFISLAAGVAAMDQIGGAGFVEDAPYTIIRVRGSFWTKSDQVVASEEFHGAFGIGIFSKPAIAIGVTAVDTPITEEDSDAWQTFGYFAHGFTFVSGVGVATPSLSRTDFDSKAMRKVNDDQNWAFMVENSSSDGGQYLAKFRMLIKLH